MRSTSQQIEQQARMATLLRRAALPPVSANQLRPPAARPVSGRMSEVYWGVATVGSGGGWSGQVNPCDGPYAVNVNTSITIGVNMAGAYGGHATSGLLTPAVYPADFPEAGDPAYVIPFQFDSRGGAWCTNPAFYAPKVGTILWLPGYPDPSPRGWQWMDGSDTSAGGSARIDMRARFMMPPGQFDGVTFAAGENGGCTDHRHGLTHDHAITAYEALVDDNQDVQQRRAIGSMETTTEQSTEETTGQIPEDGTPDGQAGKLPVPYGVANAMPAIRMV
jgi:hypothetical protein